MKLLLPLILLTITSCGMTEYANNRKAEMRTHVGELYKFGSDTLEIIMIQVQPYGYLMSNGVYIREEIILARTPIKQTNK